MEMRDLGGTGLKVSRLGLGLYEIGDAPVVWVKSELPIAPEVVKELHRRFASVGEQWIQLT